MSPEIAALLDARKALESASREEHAALSQLGIATERWLEDRPDRIRPFVETYRARHHDAALARVAVRRAERAARAAAVLCEHCEGVDGHHDTGCERPVDATEQADRLAQRAA